MLPLVLASQIRQGMEDFLRTNTTISSGFFEGLVDNFVNNSDALKRPLKGPYISLELPFLSAKDSEKHWFEELQLQFSPYAHQEKAWSRLDPSRETGPLSTLVATGTGSGKTECFMLPILEYCRQVKGREGIKAILIYPMNALATDQVERIGKTISNDPALHGVRVGLYVGGRAEQKGKQHFGSCIITDRAEMRKNPPDILLTNYKMLDYLLVRPDDKDLWKGTNEESLRYLVVDELHTFDGAQGTDLACLIRRLKARLGLSTLCCVGTSATLGSEKENIDLLLEYASDIFGQSFEADAVITEERLSLEAFLGKTVFQNSELPGFIILRDKLPAQNYTRVEDYLREQQEIWFHDYATGDLKTEEGRIRLGKLLKGNRYFRELLALTRGKTLLAKEEIADILFKDVVGFEKVRLVLLESLCSLASTALGEDGRPLLQVIRCQLWLKELRRMLVSVEQKPRIVFEADLTASDTKNIALPLEADQTANNKKLIALPLVQCRECGAAGWLSVPNKNYTLNFDLNIGYQAFFSGKENFVILYPQINKEDLLERKILLDKGLNASFCTHCGHIMPRKKGVTSCPVCGSGKIRKKNLEENLEEQDNVLLDVYWYECGNGIPHCPVCGEAHTWSILGSRAATLTSNAISLLYSSKYNTDKKLITFSDNVQDAAHRSGFFGARTFTMSFISAVEQLLLDSKKPLSLAELPEEFEKYWHEKDISAERYLVHFFPPDLEWYRAYDRYKKLRNIVSMRSSLFRELDNVGKECAQCEEAYTRDKDNIFLSEKYKEAKERVIEVQKAILTLENDTLQVNETKLDLLVKKEMSTQKEETEQLNRFVASLMKSLKKRLQWECYAVFTLRSQYRRSIENTLAALAYIPVNRLQAVAVKLSRILLQNKDIMQWGELNRAGILERCHLFLVGFLIYLRQCGAVYQNEILEYFVKVRAEVFCINQAQKQFMPRLHPNMKLPRFLTKKLHTHFEPLSEHGYATTWCMKWALAHFPDLFNKANNAPLIWIYSQALSLLKDEKILSYVYIKGQEKEDMEAWGITKDALLLTTEVVALQCPCCKRTIAIPKSDANFLAGKLSCLNCIATHSAGYPAIGKYSYNNNNERGGAFYGKLYRSGAIERLHTEEHTGLLERKNREAVEQSFKRSEENRLPFDTNLLSCTPTLEMGIDIGNLSSTIQCSVPPSQANFLQRIGRAGRKDGNALNITIANQTPHDLYFYANPLLMMQGEVTPPGVFLNASAVLERQFTAFCLDKWVKDIATNIDFPQDLRTVLSTVATKQKLKKGGSLEKVITKESAGRIAREKAVAAEELFPYNFLNYIKENAAFLFEDFIELFGEKMEQATKDLLFRFVFGKEREESPLHIKIITGLTRVLREKKGIQDRIKSAKKRIAALEEMTNKDEATETSIEELNIEIKGLKSIIQSIDRQKTLQLFCNEGLLPNYAFPEQGVTLHSLIYYEKKEVEEGIPLSPEERVSIKRIDYGRGAAMALADFAPGAYFYAGKRKVKINKIDLSTSEKERWRICPNCSYSELFTTKSRTSGRCPRCGSPLFFDRGQERDMLQLTQVYAQTSSRESLLIDETEGREPHFFLRQLLVDYKKEDVIATYRFNTSDTAFGYSYVQRASFREINFGIVSEEEQTVFSVDGRAASRPGFTICEQCGSVLSSKNAKFIEHSCDCPAHAPGVEAKILENLYLYRDFQSEALFILLPFLNDDFSRCRVDSFVAAFNLGLKLRFGGKLSHLQTLLHSFPSDCYGRIRKQYLVVYDSVPGGTGYLKHLMQEGVMMEIFSQALEALEACSCEETPQQDGCYRCLLAYRNSKAISTISKKEAITDLRIFLSYKQSLEKTNESLDEVSISVLYESELERRFIYALRTASFEDKKFLVKEELVHGKEGHLLTIGTKQWTIEQQVDIDTVPVPSRVDFLFHPVDGQGRDIVVFTDGFEFHQDRVGKDYAQRMALVLSGKYWVWSLTWDDVNSALFQKPTQPLVHNYIEQLVIPHYWEQIKAQKNIERVTNSWEGFLRVLANPDEQDWHKLSLIYITMLARANDYSSYTTKLNKERKSLSSFGLLSEEDLAPEDLTCPKITIAKATSFTGCQCYASLLGVKKGKNISTEASRTATLFILEDEEENDEFKEMWRGFLFATNILQFADKFCAVTRKGINEGEFTWIASLLRSSSEDLLDSFADNRAKELVSFLCKHKMPVPATAVKIDDGLTESLEMAWDEFGLGIVTEENEALLERAVDLGWKFYPLSSMTAEELMTILNDPMKRGLTPPWRSFLKEVIDDRTKELLFVLCGHNTPIPEAGVEIGRGQKTEGELEIAWEDLHIGLVTEENEDLLEKAVELGWKLYPLSSFSSEELIREIERARTRHPAPESCERKF